jgi:hypothetical protein
MIALSLLLVGVLSVALSLGDVSSSSGMPRTGGGSAKLTASEIESRKAMATQMIAELKENMQRRANEKDQIRQHTHDTNALAQLLERGTPLVMVLFSDVERDIDVAAFKLDADAVLRRRGLAKVRFTLTSRRTLTHSLCLSVVCSALWTSSNAPPPTWLCKTLPVWRWCTSL